MNILLVTETYLPYITGVAVSTDSIARYMVSRGHRVTLVNPRPIVKGSVKPLKNLKIINVPSLPFALYNYNATAIFPLAIPIINKLMKETKFDIVHIQEPGSVGLSALIMAKVHKIPIVGALHFIPEQVDRVIWGRFERILTPFINIYIRMIYNKYDAIMTPSHFFANYLKSLHVKKPINVISNGTDVEKFHPAPLNLALRKKLKIPEDSTVFFYLGRLDGDKNVATLIKSLPYTNKNIRLLVVGRGIQGETLKSLAKKLKVDSKIIWVDYITDDEMANFYHAANAFSIMSPYEGQSIVTLQAIASGLPLITAKAGALPELCYDGKNGFLVKTYDFKGLAAKMNELSHNKKMCEDFGKESRKISLAHHKPVVLHKLELLYKSLL